MVETRETIVFKQDGKLYDLYNLPDGFVIKDSLDLSKKNLDKLPDLSKVEVEGCFDCSNNKLTSLEGAPQKVMGMFYCSNNKLTSLEGAPKEIGMSFYCSNNKLTSLKGAPQKVLVSFDCSENNLTSLEGAPQTLLDYFNCASNKLTSLEGAPKEVGGDFWCDNNELTSLAGIAEAVKGNIYADVKNLEKYGDYVMPSSDDGDLPYIESYHLENSPVYQHEKFLNEKSKDLRRKIMRTIAAENVSPQKGVVNPKRSVGEKKVIKAVLDSVTKGITD